MPSSTPLSHREQKKLDTRNAIARAAAELFLSEGNDGMTVNAIAKRAKVAPRTFHNYFARREDALLLFIENALDELRSDVAAAPAGEHPLDTMQRLLGQRINDDPKAPGKEDPGTLLNLMLIGDHLSYVTEPEDKRGTLSVADELLDALHARADGMSRQACALLMHSAMAAGAIAAEAQASENGWERPSVFPSFATDGRKPSEVLDEGFALLRGGFK